MRSNMFRHYALSAAMACALDTVTSSAASSQVTKKPTATSLDVEAGDRVRVVAAEYGDTPQICTIAAVRGDGIVFRPERQDDTLAIPVAHLGQLDVSQGRFARPVTGMGRSDSECAQNNQQVPAPTKPTGTDLALLGACQLEGGARGLSVGQASRGRRSTRPTRSTNRTSPTPLRRSTRARW
jgi:hypothetical protein